jgi:membrane protein implicated in regulation of membrane protease activity
MPRIALAMLVISAAVYAAWYWYSYLKPVDDKESELDALETEDKVIDVEERVVQKRKAVKERRQKLSEDDNTAA